MSSLQFLTFTMSGTMLGTYGLVVVGALLALTALCAYPGLRDLHIYRITREKANRTNAILWLSGSAMCLFTMLFILLRKGWLLAVVFVIGLSVMYFSVGNGIRSQLTR